MSKNIPYLMGGVITIGAVVTFLLLVFLSGPTKETKAVKIIAKEENKIEEGKLNEEVEKGKEKINILFLGDMMLDRYIRQIAEKKSYDFVFEPTKELLRNNDLVVANLEGPITDKPSKSVTSKMGERNNFIFTFDPRVAQKIKEHNIGLVNLGNNHIYNFGEDGLTSTRQYLEQTGIKYFGDPGKEANRTAVMEFDSNKIGFVVYNQFETDGKKKTLEDIRKLKNQVDVLILYTHWGTEYEKTAGEKIISLSREFVDAGADLIIGSHPHVVQQIEEYKGKKIYYSLGNYIFDQYFSPETKQGLAVKVTIDTGSKKLDFSEISLILENNGQTKLKQ